MDVTVVIPVWNEKPSSLRRAVESARSMRSEIVVVNDGSTDGATLAALRQLPEVKLVHQANQGPAAARNAGVAAGTGRYVLPLDSDDFLSANYVDALAHVLDVHADCPLAFADWLGFGDRGDGFHRTLDRLVAGDMLRECLILAASMFRREDCEMLGGWDEKLMTGFEDWEWWLRLLLHTGGTARRAPDVFVNYQMRAASRNVVNYNGIAAFRATRLAMLANNPNNQSLIAQAIAKFDLEFAYRLGQNQSAIAEAATAVARHYERRYGHIEGLISRVQKLSRIANRSILGLIRPRNSTDA